VERFVKEEGGQMSKRRIHIKFGRRFSCVAGVLLFAAASSCSRPAGTTRAQKIAAGQEYSGFLSTYANLKPNTTLEQMKSYVTTDPAKDIHRYVAVIIDPPVVYVSTNADESAIPDRGVAALREYFQDAITDAVSDAFPVVQSSGPLVLRLRSAIVGVDVDQLTQGDPSNNNSLERALNIGKVRVEVELVDSETGEQIAAATDRQNLGEGAVVGSVSFSREQKFRAATQAFDGWAARLRQFLDSADELSPEDVKHIEATNFPYASPATPIQWAAEVMGEGTGTNERRARLPAKALMLRLLALAALHVQLD